MAVTRIQAGMVTGSASTATYTFASAQTLHNCNVVAIGYTGSSSVTVSTVTDTIGNSYSKLTGPNGVGTVRQYFYTCNNIAAATAGSNVVTVTFSGAVTGQGIAFAEYSGIKTFSLVDANTPFGGTATASTLSISTVNPTDLLLIIATSQDAWTGNSVGWTDVLGYTGPSVFQEQITSTAGTFTNTLTPTPGAAKIWAGNIFALRQTGSVTWGMAGTCAGKATLAAAAMPVSHTLAGATTGRYTSTVLLKVSHPLAAIVSAHGLATGAVNGNFSVVGTAMGVSTSPTAAVKVSHSLAGTALGAATLNPSNVKLKFSIGVPIAPVAINTGALRVSHTLAGGVAAKATMTGLENILRPCSGTITTHGTMSVAAIAVAHSLTGAIAGHATVVGAGKVTRYLAAVTPALATVVGNVKVSHSLTGGISGHATASGQPIINRHLASSGAAAKATLTGSISLLTGGWGGFMHGSAVNTGGLSVSHPVSGAISAHGSSTPVLNVLHSLSGGVTGTATVHGAVIATRLFSGTAAGVTTSSSVLLKINRRLVGGINANAILFGDLDGSHKGMRGGISSVGSLSVGPLVVTRMMSGQINVRGTVSSPACKLRYGLFGNSKGTASLSGNMVSRRLLSGSVATGRYTRNVRLSVLKYVSPIVPVTDPLITPTLKDELYEDAASTSDLTQLTI